MAGDSKKVQPIIIKRIKKGGHAAHGGAWKIAYADFVTAMMAFFLLMWLLGATEEKQRKGIADFFAPTLVKMRQESAGSDGLLGGSSLTDPDNYPNAMGQTGTRTITIPRGVTGGPVEGGGRGELEAEKLKELRDTIEKKLVQRRQLSHLARQVRVMRAPEGIRIDLMDDADYSMFALGTTSFVGWTSWGLMFACWCLCMALAAALARVLDGLSLGEATAQTLGLPLAPLRAALVALLALATGTAVAQTGLIAFVGLAAPHLVRSMVKTTSARLMLLASCMGGALLMAADTLARWLIAPQELPVGVLTAVLGGGYLLWLMQRNTRVSRGAGL